MLSFLPLKRGEFPWLHPPPPFAVRRSSRARSVAGITTRRTANQNSGQHGLLGTYTAYIRSVSNRRTSGYDGVPGGVRVSHYVPVQNVLKPRVYRRLYRPVSYTSFACSPLCGYRSTQTRSTWLSTVIYSQDLGIPYLNGASEKKLEALVQKSLSLTSAVLKKSKEKIGVQ